MEFCQKNGWLTINQSIVINREQRVAVIYPQKQVDGDTYGHVNVLEENGEMKSVTDGKFEVLKIMKWDADTNYM